VTTLAHERAGVIAMAAELEHRVSRQLLRALSEQSASPSGAGSAIMRERIARCYADARIAGLLGMRALEVAERGAPEGAQQSLIKLVWATTMQEVAETMLELQPSAGYDAVADAYLFSRATTIAGGTTEILKSLAGERVLGLAREPKP
jgi:alkylation response protein AidB-like acyl-CoA dehydrogenase